MTTPALLLTGSFVAAMTLAAILDLRFERIPNWLTGSALAAALVLRGVAQSGAGVLDGLTGGAVALLAGVILFAAGVMGGGDAKLLAVVGAFLGPARLLVALLAASVLGGVLAIAVAVRRGRILPVALRTWEFGAWILSLGRTGSIRTLGSNESLSVPYGVAIAAGALLTWFLPGG